MQLKEFWSEVGSTKDFQDPFFMGRFEKWLGKDDKIVEYGCGYGRILNNLWTEGYQNLQGFDFASRMIERGERDFPHLDLYLLEQSGKIPLEDRSVDGVILSTVLCCNAEKKAQEAIIDELARILKMGGVLYLCEFLITQNDKQRARYEGYAKQESEDYGVYRTNEGVLVRHHTLRWILDLLSLFDIQWLEQLDDVTMNGNPVRTVHLIAQKI